MQRTRREANSVFPIFKTFFGRKANLLLRYKLSLRRTCKFCRRCCCKVMWHALTPNFWLHVWDVLQFDSSEPVHSEFINCGNQKVRFLHESPQAWKCFKGVREASLLFVKWMISARMAYCVHNRSTINATRRTRFNLLPFWVLLICRGDRNCQDPG